jgi:hypothetical protein
VSHLWRKSGVRADSSYVKEIFKIYFVRTVHFGMKLYNDQLNAQVFN